MDKRHDALIAALRLALAEPAEQRLFRSGKLPGLFATRTGPAGEAAAEAVRAGLLEVVRRETRGKVEMEWVRLTPDGVSFLHAHESPRAILEELRNALDAARGGVRPWLGEMLAEVRNLQNQLEARARELFNRLDALSDRVDEALKRVEGGAAAVNRAAAQAVPWAAEALAYLDRRHHSGDAGDCPLPELFAAVRAKFPGLSIGAFHDGLRQLGDYKALRLVAFAGPPGHLAEPEYAILDGAKVLYHAARAG